MTALRRLPIRAYPPFARSPMLRLVQEANGAATMFRAILLGGSWEQLYDHSTQLVAHADRLLRYLRLGTDRHRLLMNYLSIRDSALRRAFAELQADTSSDADQYRAAMIDELTDALGNAADAQTALDQLLAGDHPLFSSAETERDGIAIEQKTLIAHQVQLAVLANRAIVEACTYQAYDYLQSMGPGRMVDQDDMDALVGNASELRNLHDETVQDLFDQLNSDTDMDSFVDFCTARKEEVSLRLQLSATLLGAGRILLMRDGQSLDPLVCATALLDLAEGIKRISMMYGYLCSVRAVAATTSINRWYSDEKRRAKARQVGSGVASGQRSPIDAILSGTVAEGSLVFMEGQVAELRIVDDPAPPKYSSIFELMDLASPSRVLIRAHMFSLANNGLRDGALVRLNGFVRLNPSSGGPVEVDIDRVSLTDLRKHSWYDDVTYRTRPHVQLYQDEMSMFFTP